MTTASNRRVLERALRAPQADKPATLDDDDVRAALDAGLIRARAEENKVPLPPATPSR